MTSFPNTSHGFQIVGQWQLSKLVALLNGGCGFYVAGIISGGNSNGQWTGLATFGNGSHGIWIDGSVNAVHSIRISDSFIGADGGHGILDDSHSSTPNLYTNVYVEGEPGDGFNFTANAGNVSLVNCVASCLGSGVKSFAAATSIHGGQFMQNQLWRLDRAEPSFDSRSQYQRQHGLWHRRERRREWAGGGWLSPRWQRLRAVRYVGGVGRAACGQRRWRVSCRLGEGVVPSRSFNFVAQGCGSVPAGEARSYPPPPPRLQRAAVGPQSGRTRLL